MTGTFVIANWRILLLALASVVLSTASGWTTWDGMSNFTQAPLLSFLITFGIQSVLLISAWMLGEALVNRFRPAGMRQGSSIKSRIIAALVVVLALLALNGPAIVASSPLQEASGQAKTLLWLAGILACIAAMAALVIGLRRSAGAFANPVRAMVNTTLLSAMFLACMATSVFFSFDSLFTSVFPANERARTSEIRAQSRSDGILNDLTVAAQESLADARTHALEGAVWKNFNERLDAVQAQMREAAAKLRFEAAGLTRETQSANQSRHEQRAQLSIRLESIRAEEANAKAMRVQALRRQEEIAKAAADLEKTIQQLSQQLTASEEAMLREEAGLGVTGRSGRGEQYNLLKADFERLKLSQRSRLIDRSQYAESLAAATQAVAQKDREIARLSASQTKTQAEISALDDDMSVPSELTRKTERIEEIEKSMAALQERRGSFERLVTPAALDDLGRSCEAALDAMATVTGSAARSLCVVVDVQRALAPVAAMIAGATERAEHCRSLGSSKTEQLAIEANIARARECVQMANLPSTLAADFRRRIDDIERNRDDKAHRFIVTLNAFSDGNRLAYLALAIAVCIDGLVFVAGLLGAATRASPLSMLPGALGHTVAGADRIMRSSLQPHAARNASITLAAIRPLPNAGTESGSDFTHRITVPDTHVADAAVINRMVSAAAGIGAARRLDGAAETYAIRRQIVDFLALHMTDLDGNQQPPDTTNHRASQFLSALGNDPERTAVIMMRLLQPAAASDDGYICRLALKDATEAEGPILQRALNAAAVASAVRPEGDPAAGRYLLHRDICEVMLGMTKDRPTQRAGAESAELRRPRHADVTVASADRSPKDEPGRSPAPPPSASRDAPTKHVAASPEPKRNGAATGSPTPDPAPTSDSAARAQAATLPASAFARQSARPVVTETEKSTDQGQTYSLGKFKLSATQMVSQTTPKTQIMPKAAASTSAPAIRAPQPAIRPKAIVKPNVEPPKADEPPARLKVSIAGDTIVFE